MVDFEAANKCVSVLTSEREYLICSTLVRATHIATVVRDEAGKAM